MVEGQRARRGRSCSWPDLDRRSLDRTRLPARRTLTAAHFAWPQLTHQTYHPHVRPSHPRSFAMVAADRRGRSRASARARLGRDLRRRPPSRTSRPDRPSHFATVSLGREDADIYSMLVVQRRPLRSPFAVVAADRRGSVRKLETGLYKGSRP
jgi:hypothetical protein